MPCCVATCSAALQMVCCVVTYRALYRAWAHSCHICTRTGRRGNKENGHAHVVPLVGEPGLGSTPAHLREEALLQSPGVASLPHLRRDWVSPCHICAGDAGSTLLQTAPGLDSTCSSSSEAFAMRVISMPPFSARLRPRVRCRSELIASEPPRPCRGIRDLALDCGGVAGCRFGTRSTGADVDGTGAS